MRFFVFFSFLLPYLLVQQACAQVVVPDQLPEVKEKAFDDRLQDLLKFSVPLMGVKELAAVDRSNYLILDARELEEYNVSHIPDAIFFGYKNPAWDILDQVSKDQEIVLYCSVGYRSEKMAEEFLARGFNRVHNLYGSIFEWANQGQRLENEKGEGTKQIHTYNRRWSQWVVDAEGIEKVW